MTLPPGPYTARGNRIYAADGEEIGVATRRSIDETALLFAASKTMHDTLVMVRRWHEIGAPVGAFPYASVEHALKLAGVP